MFKVVDSAAAPISIDIAMDFKAPKCPSPKEIISGLCNGTSSQFLQKMATLGTVWRYPYYREWLLQHSFLPLQGDCAESKAKTALRYACSFPFKSLARASFIEWRYYSIISKEFHGIFGAAIFNPEQRFSKWAESGLLVILAGVVGATSSVAGAETNALEQQNPDFCWMKLFPMSSLQFTSGDVHEVTGAHNGVSFSMRQHSLAHSRVSMSGAKAPTLNFESKGFYGSEIGPQIGRDVSCIPGSHWIVNNPAPIARTEGTLEFAHAFSDPKNGLKFPNFVSENLNAAAKISLDGSGYYEHSFGINPMPLHGWDFFFVPNPNAGNSLVMQTYRNSKELCYIDVHWTSQNNLCHKRFQGDEISLEWTEVLRHPEMKKDVPRERIVRASSNGYQLEVRNVVSHHIPFLRPEKFFVRHFHISEEISHTSWVLRDPKGSVVCAVENQPSGGETASLRVFT